MIVKVLHIDNKYRRQAATKSALVVRHDLVLLE